MRALRAREALNLAFVLAVLATSRLARGDQTGTLGGFLEPPATTPLGKAQLRQRNACYLRGLPGRGVFSATFRSRA
ncbi:MAG TPA: hypothetical protein VLT58_03705, partial [Polyangia bacterium]|nr:hypothetical protein [Polyangia bacterium]